MTDSPAPQGLLILLAASLVSAVLGSVHAFSVFLEPLEAQFGASRSMVSLTYSLALVTLTVAVLLGHRIFARWGAGGFVTAVALLAASGAWLAGQAGSLVLVWLGYSLVFGGANGLGYGFALQIAAQANKGREGLSMGVVTAAYALGAVLSPGLFTSAVAEGGFAAAMQGLAAVLAGTGLIAGLILHVAGARFTAPPPPERQVPVRFHSYGLMWLGYCGGVAAGLMVIGHAAGIAAVFSPGTAAWTAPAVIAVCNLLGSLAGGRLADVAAPGRVLAGLPLLTVLALAGLASFGSAGGLLVCLGLIGFAYGGTIAATPSVIAKRFGMEESARIYGRVFTAWGTAGLAAPWLAGALFDRTGGYRVALIVAGCFGVVSVVTAAVYYRHPPTSSA